jgi:hypothetical protein
MTWKKIDTLLDSPKKPLVLQDWPKKEDLSAMDAIRRLCGKKARKLSRKRRLLGGLLKVPVVAVAGLLNGGKSSLIASFLSSEGRRRVLRGDKTKNGTHRFTLWAPEAWKDDAEMRAPLNELLEEVSGQAFDELEEAPETAREQQRCSEKIGCPLLAFDSGLDRHGLCLLDCPDIERPDDDADGERREALEKFGRICAGVLMVVPRRQIECQQVLDVRRALPETQCLLALNSLRAGSRTEDVIVEAREAFGDSDIPVYVAYDFELRDYEQLTPCWDPNLETDSVEKHPCFFEASSDPEANKTDHVAESRSLHYLSKHFPPEKILKKRQAALAGEFAADLRECLDCVDSKLAAGRKKAEGASKKLSEKIRQLLYKDGKPVVKIDPELLGAASEAALETAPLDIKIALKTNRMLSRGGRVLGSGIKALTPKHVQQALQWFFSKFDMAKERGGKALDTPLSKPETLARELARWSSACKAHRKEGQWRESAETILERFRDKERTDISREDLAGFAREFWRHAPKWKIRGTILTGAGLALGILALIPFDGGATLVAANVVFVKSLLAYFGLKGSVLVLTSHELIAVLGGVALAQCAAGQNMADRIDECIADQQHANFLAIAFDELGLPREFLPEGMPAPTIAEEPNLSGYGIKTLKISIAEINTKVLRTLSKSPTHKNHAH